MACLCLERWAISGQRLAALVGSQWAWRPQQAALVCCWSASLLAKLSLPQVPLQPLQLLAPQLLAPLLPQVPLQPLQLLVQ